MGLSIRGNKPLPRWLPLILAAALAVFFVPGCKSGGLWDKLFGNKGSEIDPVPQELANEGIEYLRTKQYTLAIDSFQRLKDHYPYSKYALLAELKIADTYYMKKDYIEALAAYQEFERLHPTNEAVPYVVYQQGMCLYGQMTGYDRDQTPVVQAIQTFTRLQHTYPGTRYAAQAQARIIEAQNSLAHHEYYVGEFYYGQGNYKAALGRFKSLVENYPDTGFHMQALEYIRICQDLLGSEGVMTANSGGEKTGWFSRKFGGLFGKSEQEQPEGMGEAPVPGPNQEYPVAEPNQEPGGYPSDPSPPVQVAEPAQAPREVNEASGEKQGWFSRKFGRLFGRDQEEQAAGVAEPPPQPAGPPPPNAVEAPPTNQGPYPSVQYDYPASPANNQARRGPNNQALSSEPPAPEPDMGNEYGRPGLGRDVAGRSGLNHQEGPPSPLPLEGEDDDEGGLETNPEGPGWAGPTPM